MTVLGSIADTSAWIYEIYPRSSVKMLLLGSSLIRFEMMVTLEQALLTVNQLPIEQREMLVEIVKNQLIEARRQEIAEDAEKAIAAFHQGQLQPQPIETIIAELKATLTQD
ncbi:hypothetical protein [Gloeothece verrucosa]|uniref:Uncharacterized protein n=1 Tax=Gloeothece verrucosa (strain PCC 7822) TaxID=497965 RepID=E0UCD5_GLOV7|nr:hypothetical protein [Gloeothece verrucosa]ADN12892.1 hypothetical protein Cyan7822_0872 [Gloeothece verrucosa PCC 7822]